MNTESIKRIAEAVYPENRVVIQGDYGYLDVLIQAEGGAFIFNPYEYFAGLAMQGMLSTERGCAAEKDDISSHAVGYADALLEALSQPEG